MLLVIDKYIPFPATLPIPELEILALEPECITSEAVRNADALIVRTRTQVNQSLLDGSSVQFVATATIGYDHIDTSYCEANHIAWTACPGCNAQAVCDFIEESLNFAADKTQTIGIVGVGHIGSLVAKMAERKGLRVLLNDSPKRIGVSINEIAEKCDLISFHTPLTFMPNPFPTFHLCNKTFLHHCKKDAIIINSARGGIFDEEALIQSGHRCIIDCWENEPNINTVFAQSEQVILASYHIAGYSQDGKINASQMCMDAFCKHFGFPALTIEKKSLPLHAEIKGDSAPGWLERVSRQLKANPSAFEQLRKQYKLR